MVKNRLKKTPFFRNLSECLNKKIKTIISKAIPMLCTRFKFVYYNTFEK